MIDQIIILIPDSAIKESDVFSYLSPRLGFAFPVTDQTVFHMQFGKFVQAPALDQTYRGEIRSSSAGSWRQFVSES